MIKKEIKRREEKEEKNKKKRSKPTYIKKGKPKKLGRTIAPAHNFDPKILREGSAKLRWAGPRDLIFHSLCSLHVVQWSEKSL